MPKETSRRAGAGLSSRARDAPKCGLSVTQAKRDLRRLSTGLQVQQSFNSNRAAQVSLKTAIASRLSGDLTSEARQQRLRRRTECRRRKAGTPHVIEDLHQADDPYSHLAVQGLQRLASATMSLSDRILRGLRPTRLRPSANGCAATAGLMQPALPTKQASASAIQAVSRTPVKPAGPRRRAARRCTTL